LARWQLPERLVQAIAAPKKQARLARMTPAEGDLPQILHLAELLLQLVSQRQLDVLPDLLDAGKAYRGMTKSILAALVEGLQPQVDQLAEVLSLELAEDRDYVQVLLEAHQKMASLSEQVASEQSTSDSADDAIHAELLSQTRELCEAMREFLARGRKSSSDTPSFREWNAQHAPHDQEDSLPASGGTHIGGPTNAAGLLRKLSAAVGRCRERRLALSLLLVEPNEYDADSDSGAVHASQNVRSALLEACQSLDQTSVSVVSLDEERTAVILANCERSAAVTLAHNIADMLSSSETSDGTSQLDTTLSIGVATASVVPKNFDPLRLVESAQRCLAAARACGITTVKSIEV
jgi:hypothetical protein